MNFEWKIIDLNRFVDDGYVNSALWQCTCTEESLSQSMASICYFQGELETPYNELTQDIVLGWCWSYEVDKKAVENILKSKIVEMKNKPCVSGKPW